jgi:2-hydroxymuconate-semialdehyde hydrolase
VVAVDLNGFGFTERPRDAEAYTLDGQVELVRRVMARLDLGRADVVGHSYGGYLAMRLARDHPQRVRRLVLISPALNMQVPASGVLRSAVFRQAAYPLFRLLVSDRDRFARLLARAYHRQELLDGVRIWEYQRRLLVEGLGPAYRGFGESLESLGDDPVRLSELDVPLLVVGARHDAVVPLASLRIALRKDGAVAPLEVLDHSGHSAPEEEPERLAELVGRFLDER